MSKHKVAGIAVAALLFGSGAAVAASAFPQSVDETAPLSIPFTKDRTIAGDASVRSMVPSSPSEAPRFTFSAQAMSSVTEPLGAVYGSVYPTSAIETGGYL